MSFFETLWRVYGISIKNSIVYRFSMLLSLLTGPLFISTYYFIWKAVYETSGLLTIGGLAFEEMIIYIVLSFSMLYLTWDMVEERLIQSVHRGELTIYLVKPIPFWRYEFFLKMGHRSYALLIEYIPVLIMMGLIFGFSIFSSTNYLWYLVMVILAFIISFEIRMILGMLAFWVVKPRGFIHIYRALWVFLNGVFMPLTFYPLFLQKVLLVLPFQFIAYVPARVFIGSYELAGLTLLPWQLLLLGLAQVIVLYGLIRLIWHFSIKRYCGVGA